MPVDAQTVVVHQAGKPTEYRVEKNEDGTWKEVITFKGRNGLRSANSFVKFIKGEKQ